MHVADRRTHLFGLSDQRVALVGELLQQAADADLIIAVGALERGNLVVNERFELAGARERSLNAIAHGRHFAADGLSDGHDGIARYSFGLAKLQGHFRHGLRDHAQFLRAPGHMGDAEKEDDRQQRRGTQRDEQCGRRVTRTQRGVQVRQIEPRQGHASDQPGRGKQGGDDK